MRSTIEDQHGPLPEDLQDEARDGGPAGMGSPPGSSDPSGNSSGADAKYMSDDDAGGEGGRKDKDNKGSPLMASRFGEKLSPGAAGGASGAAGGGRSYVADVAESKGYQFSVNKNPINVERYVYNVIYIYVRLFPVAVHKIYLCFIFRSNFRNCHIILLYVSVASWRHFKLKSAICTLT